MAKSRKKLSKKALFKKRSEAAKKGWKTRRKRIRQEAKDRKIRKLEAEVARLKDELAIQEAAKQQATKKAAQIYRTRPFLEKDPKKRKIFQEEAQAKKARQQLAQERKQAKKFKQDPNALRESIKKKMSEVWDENPKDIPEFVKGTYDWLSSMNLDGEIDEYELWDLYKES